MPPDQDWPPPKARLRAALWRLEDHLGRGEFFAAAQAVEEVLELVPPEERGFCRGLHHLAAAGYRHQCGDERGRERQLAHARRRLAPFLPVHRELDVAALVAAVERL